MEVGWRAEGTERVHERIAGLSRFPVPRRGRLSIWGVVSLVERKSGRKLTEQAGHATPDGMQRVLSICIRDVGLVRSGRRTM